MQRLDRPIDRGVEPDGAARAEIDQRPPRLMHRPVADEPQIGRKFVRILAQDVLQMRRARLLLAFPYHLDVHGWLLPNRFQRIERRKECKFGNLVVAGGARIEPPFGIVRRLGFLPVHHMLAAAERPAAHHRIERRSRPLRRCYRLAVIMCIEDYSARCARRGERAENNRRRIGNGEKLRLKAARLQFILQPGASRRRSLRLGSNTVKAQQRVELREDLRLMRRAPAIHLLLEIVRVRRYRATQKSGAQTCRACCFHESLPCSPEIFASF